MPSISGLWLIILFLSFWLCHTLNPRTVPRLLGSTMGFPSTCEVHARESKRDPSWMRLCKSRLVFHKERNHCISCHFTWFSLPFPPSLCLFLSVFFFISLSTFLFQSHFFSSLKLGLDLKVWNPLRKFSLLRDKTQNKTPSWNWKGQSECLKLSPPAERNDRKQTSYNSLLK